jgi:hypothetical protein
MPAIVLTNKAAKLMKLPRHGISGRKLGPPGEPRVSAFRIGPGVYDVTADAAWVSVGITHDTVEFAVA